VHSSRVAPVDIAVNMPACSWCCGRPLALCSRIRVIGSIPAPTVSGRGGREHRRSSPRGVHSLSTDRVSRHAVTPASVDRVGGRPVFVDRDGDLRAWVLAQVVPCTRERRVRGPRVRHAVTPASVDLVGGRPVSVDRDGDLRAWVLAQVVPCTRERRVRGPRVRSSDADLRTARRPLHRRSSCVSPLLSAPCRASFSNASIAFCRADPSEALTSSARRLRPIVPNS